MRDPKKRAISNACHWLKRCYDLGITANEVIAQSAASQLAASRAASRKENEGEKRTSPLHPPIEKRAKQEKDPPPPPARAREEKSGVKEGRYVKGIPTLEDVNKYATDFGIPHDFAKEWFDLMCQRKWLHPKSNELMDCWWSYLSSWYKMRNKFGPIKEPEPDSKEKKPKVYKREDWELCAERCRFFDAAKGVCTRGYRVPPDKDTWQHSPEQCEKFGEKVKGEG